MALCTAPLLINERNRWREMSDRQLFRRLQQITKPEKLSCFLFVATDLHRSTLLRDGIDRCNALGFAPIERGDGWWDVIVADRYRTDTIADDRPEPDFDEEDEDGGMLVPDDIAEEIARGPAGRAFRSPAEIVDSIRRGAEPVPDPRTKVGKVFYEEKPKKKKSIYSRKLRTKRRK